MSLTHCWCLFYKNIYDIKVINTGSTQIREPDKWPARNWPQRQLASNAASPCDELTGCHKSYANTFHWWKSWVRVWLHILQTQYCNIFINSCLWLESSGCGYYYFHTSGIKDQKKGVREKGSNLTTITYTVFSYTAAVVKEN